MGDKGLARPRVRLYHSLGPNGRDPSVRLVSVEYGVAGAQTLFRRDLGVRELDVKADEDLPRRSTARPPLRVRSMHRLVEREVRLLIEHALSSERTHV